MTLCGHMVPLVHPFIYHLLICQGKWHMTHWKVYDTQCYLHISIARRSDARARAYALLIQKCMTTVYLIHIVLLGRNSHRRLDLSFRFNKFSNYVRPGDIRPRTRADPLNVNVRHYLSEKPTMIRKKDGRRKRIKSIA